MTRAVTAARCCRSKAAATYTGRTRGIMVHKLPPVRREEVILPEATLKLLDRNVLNFVDEPPAVAPARTIDAQGHPAVRAARHRQDPHHPLSREQPARPHHPDHHRRAGRVASAVYGPCPPAAARDGRDRGCRPHCTRSRKDGALRRIDAQRAAQPDGWIEAGCGYPVRPHHQPAGATRGRAGRPARPHRPGDRGAASGRHRPQESWSSSMARACRSAMPS